MSQKPLIRGRRRPPRKRSRQPLGQVLAAAPAGAAPAAAYPGYTDLDQEGAARTLVSGGLAALLHGGGLLVLLVVASLAPVIEEQLIPVRILQEELPPPPPPDEPAPAPKALAERRALPFAPAVQAVQPQIINPRVLAAAAPRVNAEALEMAAVDASATPTEVDHSLPVVERVSAVSSSARARVSPVDLSKVTRRAVRGPTQVAARVGPSVGPRRVEAAELGDSFGTAPLQVGNGNGSSVREGILSDRDVVGSPDGALVVSVDTSLGDSPYGGSGGTGTSVTSNDDEAVSAACVSRPEVQSYIASVESRVLQRWVLPPGVDLDRKVTLRFSLDVAGSPSQVELVRAEDNALGASAIDALRSAAPFPPLPEKARCLAQRAITGTFTNPLDG